MLKFSVSAAALAAGLVLSACSGGGGGGGIGSAGGSAPGTGSGTTPAPAPTPTPTPNASLLALNSSETFTNDGATAVGNFPTNGASSPTLNIAFGSISVAYDARARSYTITSGTRSQTFLPSDRDAATSTAQLTMFKRGAGAKTDTLALTAIGTSGAFTYQYVGAGYWQHTENGADTIAGSVDAFIYGIRTQDSAMPRTGTGTYALDLIGIESGINSQPEALAALAGSGRMDVDFMGGRMLFDGTGRRVPVTTLAGNAYLPTFTFRGDANLTAGTASFKGQMAIDGGGGDVSGRFFGPGAEEVGASFTTTWISGGKLTTVGTLTGRRKPEDSAAAIPLANLTSPQSFAIASGVSPIQAEVQNSRGTEPGKVASFTGWPNGAWSSLGFDPAAKSYTFDGRTFTAANAVSAESSDGVKTYRQVDGDKSATLRIYTPNGSNGSVALTYSAFADYMTLQQPATGTTDPVARLWSIYGVNTPSDNVPRVGNATYAGAIYGYAVRGGDAPYDMRGTASITVDFVSRTIGGELRPLFTPAGGGTTQDFGGLTLSGRIEAAPNTNTFSGGATPMNNSTASIGIAGRFFGPSAQEAGVSFGGTWKPEQFGGTLRLQGVAIGKRQ
ncbi:transferrin-binding protein-like solute binding protein [Sphingomonas trueperi]|uniref:Transferrin-binding protein B C-lobe/N-lobe beta-barrel domain-containing protein n=1 Tax=Sphingomonas trueperi TaxID=53317 RepID=A0A7X5XYI1_9SPHN|nr:transferrin-binding protein-like solute binding protein [Sphingomonas trueperi]NJB96560.1 hypothetical protein [Sphingomonas trueperi]